MLEATNESLNPAIEAAIEERDKRSAFWRAFREELIGIRWRQGMGRKRVSNLVYSYVTTMLALLAPASPRVALMSRYGETGRVLADVFEQALNDVIKQRNLLETLQASIFDSFYAFGIVKTGLLPDPSDSMVLVPFAESISPFRFIWDDTARTWRHCQFTGHEFTKLRSDVENDPRYPLVSEVDWSTVETTKSAKRDSAVSEDQTSGLTRDAFNDKLPESVYLLEMWLRDSNQIVTLVRLSSGKYQIIRADPFGGREGGPYHIFGYTYLSDAVVPVSPAQGWWEQWRELEEQEYDLLQQVKNEKTVVAFPQGGQDSARIVAEAKKHSFITGVQELGEQRTYGGVTAQKITAVADARQRFEGASGLSEVKRGLQPQTKDSATSRAIQDKYSSLSTARMLAAIMSHATEIIEDWKDYMWYDPNVVTAFSYTDAQTRQPLDLTMTGGGMEDGSGITPADMLVEVKEESLLRHDDPMERAAAMQELGVILGPVAQYAMMQGYMPDVMYALRWMEEKFGRDDLQRFFIPMTPLAMAMKQMNQMEGANPGAVSSVTNIDAPPSDQQDAMGAGMDRGEMFESLPATGGMQKQAGMRAAPQGNAQKPKRY